MTYAGFLADKLKESGADEGCMLNVDVSGKAYRGVLMPHHEFSAPDILIL